MIRAIEPIPSGNIVETLITCDGEKDGYIVIYEEGFRGHWEGEGRRANTKYSRKEQKLQVARYHSGAHLFYMCTTTISFVIIRSIREEYLDLICCLSMIFKDLEPFKHAFYWKLFELSEYLYF